MFGGLINVWVLFDTYVGWMKLQENWFPWLSPLVYRDLKRKKKLNSIIKAGCWNRKMLQGAQGDVQGQRTCGSNKAPMELWLSWGSREEVSNSEKILSFAVLGSRTSYGLRIWSAVSCILNTALERFLDFNIKLSLLIIWTEKSQKTVFLTFPRTGPVIWCLSYSQCCSGGTVWLIMISFFLRGQGIRP